jgi:biotin carboxylase
VAKRLLIVDIGYGPRPAWYLPRLCPSYDVRVVWRPTGDDRRDRARAATFDEWCRHDRLDVDGPARDAVVEIARSWGADGICTFGELAVGDVHAACAELGLPGNSAASLPALRDKYIQRRMLRAAGVPTPEFAAVSSLDDLIAALARVGTPSVLKPLAGAGSMATYGIEADTDIPALWSRACDSYLGDARGDGTTHFIVESFLVGRRRHADVRYGWHVSVESIVADGEISHFSVSDKFPLVPNFREPGDILPSSLPGVEIDELYAATTAALRAVGITNSATHTEFMLTDRGPMVIEVNSRIGGGVTELLHYACDYDVVGAIAAIATGQPIAPPTPPRRAAAFFTPQCPADCGPLVAAPTAEQLRALPYVVEATVNYRAGETPDWTGGTKGGTLARMFAVSDQPGPLLDLSSLLASDELFRYEPA